jgi:hypothetical protein
MKPYIHCRKQHGFAPQELFSHSIGKASHGNCGFTARLGDEAAERSSRCYLGVLPQMLWTDGDLNDSALFGQIGRLLPSEEIHSGASFTLLIEAKKERRKKIYDIRYYKPNTHWS